MGRLDGKIAIVVGAGRIAGATVGNCRAVALLQAREGARVLAADGDLESADQTVTQIEEEGGEAFAVRLDVSIEDEIAGMVAACRDRWGRIDIPHNTRTSPTRPPRPALWPSPRTSPSIRPSPASERTRSCPGSWPTPMAIERRVGRGGATREQVLAERQALVPLCGRIGAAWDVAHAAVFLASDEAGVSGSTLVVDGGQSLVRG